MKKIIIIHSNMELGGAETSLIGLLHSFDYTKIAVDLFLLEKKGELLSLIPQEVNILNVPPQYESLVKPIKTVLKNCQVMIALARIWAKMICSIETFFRKYSDYGYILKQRMHYYSLPFLPEIKGCYDMAISFNDPHFILNKVRATLKIGWFHTDFSRIKIYSSLEKKMWEICHKIVNVSESCKSAFDEKHKTLIDRSIVIENILSKNLILKQADDFFTDKEMILDNTVKLLSIGRFCPAKNFDNIPDICKRISENGIQVKWYIVGYGGDEELIREKIKNAGMQDQVILLGKKENPYPYIKACDIYVQPSRYEGKCVAVREAQILEKPVIITNYATAVSQLQHGVDGVIVSMDNKDCANGITSVIRDTQLQKKLIENTKDRDYTNCSEVEKLYALME